MSEPATRDTTVEERLVERGLYELAAALDGRDWAALGERFTPDATGYGKKGRAEIVAQVRRHLGGCGPSQHLLGNVRVTVDGDRARSLAYARVHHRGAGEHNEKFYECLGEYDDSWLRTPEGWRVTHRWFQIQIESGDRAVLRPA